MWYVYTVIHYAAALYFQLYRDCIIIHRGLCVRASNFEAHLCIYNYKVVWELAYVTDTMPYRISLDGSWVDSISLSGNVMLAGLAWLSSLQLKMPDTNEIIYVLLCVSNKT